MAAKGYGTYHGRSRLRTALKVVIVLLVVLLVLAVATLLLMDGHIVYSSDGIRLDSKIQMEVINTKHLN